MTAQVMERIERGKTHEGRGQRREEGVEGQDRGMERRAEERRGFGLVWRMGGWRRMGLEGRDPEPWATRSGEGRRTEEKRRREGDEAGGSPISLHKTTDINPGSLPPQDHTSDSQEGERKRRERETERETVIHYIECKLAT